MKPTRNVINRQKKRGNATRNSLELNSFSSVIIIELKTLLQETVWN